MAGEDVVEGWSPFGIERVRGDDRVFELLSAAVFQARFRPAIVRSRWPSIREAFAGFDLEEVASWLDDREAALLEHPGMIRSPKKIRATLRNARDLAERGRSFGSVDAYLDSFPAEDALVEEVDRWAHYIGAPSIRWFVRSLHRDG